MDIYQLWFQHYRRDKIVDKLPQGKVGYLKAKIIHRLLTEDYTCRLPKPRGKPVYRYKLRLRSHIFDGDSRWPKKMKVWK